MQRIYFTLHLITMNHSKRIFSFLTMLSFLYLGCKDDDPKPFEPLVALQINHEWNDSELILNKEYYWEQGFKTDSITPTTLTFREL